MKEDLKEFILESLGEADFYEELDNALLGYVDRAGGESYILYDKSKINVPLADIPEKYLKRLTVADLSYNLDKIADEFPDLQLFDDIDSAIIGLVETKNGLVILYDSDKCFEAFINDDTDYEQAQEHFYNNVECAWIGEKTPAFATLLEEEAE